jgi:hypothetical protein
MELGSRLGLPRLRRARNPRGPVRPHLGHHRGAIAEPAEIWFDDKTKELFVADGYTNHRVVVYDGLAGQYLRNWGADGKAPCDAREGCTQARPGSLVAGVESVL